MPHLSKKNLSLKVVKEADDNILAFLSETSPGTRKRIFREILTRTEKLMIAKRLTLLLLIEKDLSTYEISEQLGISSSTVLKYADKVDKGYYKHTRTWLNNDLTRRKVLKLVIEMTDIFFNARHKSINKFLKEYV